MPAAMLIAALVLSQPAEDALLTKLDASVAKWLRDDPHASEVREAVHLLAETNSSSRWTNYSSATKILRETRSKAGIPLLLAYMVRHTDVGNGHIMLPAYAETLTIL